jgi:hypothetical protein
MNKKTKRILKPDPKPIIPEIDMGEDFIVLSEPKVESGVITNIDLSKNSIDNRGKIETTKVLNEIFVDDFEIENDETITDSKINFDPKVLYSKSLETKRKPAIYATIRTILIIVGLLFFVLISALSIGYNISEFENPDLGGKEIINEITNVINPGLNQPNMILPRPPFGGINPNRLNRLPPEIVQKIEQHRGANLITRIFGLSFEFVVVAAILTLLSYLIYRHTDWPFVKNKVLLAFLIVLVSVIISLGFWMLFRNDSRIPRALRGHRDVIRERVFRRQGPSSQVVESIEITPNN